MPPAPTFPQASAMPVRAGLSSAGRIGIVRCLAAPFDPSRVARQPHRCFGGSPARFRPRPRGPGRFRSGFHQACAWLSPFPVVRPEHRCSFRPSGFRSPIGTAVPIGSRFAVPSPEGPVPPDKLRKVGSALALEPLPRASSSGRPAASSAASILANFGHVRRGVRGLSLSSVSGRPLPSTN